MHDLTLVQGQEINVAIEFLNLTGNGLAPYTNLDPTSWSAAIAIGYVNPGGSKQLIAFASLSGASCLTAVSGISGVSAATALCAVLSLATADASAYVGGVNSAPIALEVGWNDNPSGSTALLNAAQTWGTIKTGYVGVGLPAPI